MADKETESQTADTSGTENQTEDFKAKYEEMQGKFETEKTAKEEAESTLETVTPFVNFDKMAGREETEEAEASKATSEEKPAVDVKKAVAEAVGPLVGRIRAMQFTAEHPELKGYESTLVSPILNTLGVKHPTWTPEKLMDEAAKQANTFLDTERAKGKAGGKKEDDAAAVAESLGESAGNTAAETETAEGESNVDYITRRQAESKTARGVMPNPA